MKSWLSPREILALSRIGATRVESGGGQALAEPVARRLAEQRLATPDEYGNMRITERGEQHLGALDRRGLVARAVRTAGSTAPASPYRRRG